jgi:hypothetical protein
MAGPLDAKKVNGLAQQMTKRPLERALRGELPHHLGYDKHVAVQGCSLFARG